MGIYSTIEQHGVVGDESTGEVEDFDGRAVVFFKNDRWLADHEVFLKSGEIFGVGMAPTEDGLLVVGNHKDVFVLLGEHFDKRILFLVCVLKFVYEDVLELGLIGLQNAVVCLQEVVGEKYEVIEVYEAVLFEFCFIGF